MILTITVDIKKDLVEEDFNDGFIMMSHLKTLLQSSGEAEFMRLCKKYYTQFYGNVSSNPNASIHKDMLSFPTHVKLLEERMDVT